MSLHRLRPRRDANEPAIRAYLEAHGVFWQPLSITGGPDGIAAANSRMALVEVKQPGEKLRPNQEDWQHTWPGPAPWLIRTEEDAAQLVRWLKAEPFGGGASTVGKARE